MHSFKNIISCWNPKLNTLRGYILQSIMLVNEGVWLIINTGVLARDKQSSELWEKGMQATIYNEYWIGLTLTCKLLL